MTESDVLAAVRQDLTKGTSGIYSSGLVNCRAVQVPKTKVAKFLPPGVTTSTVWVIFVTGKLNVRGVGAITPPPGLKNMTSTVVYFLADHHPLQVLASNLYATSLPPELSSL